MLLKMELKTNINIYNHCYGCTRNTKGKGLPKQSTILTKTTIQNLVAKVEAVLVVPWIGFPDGFCGDGELGLPGGLCGVVGPSVVGVFVGHGLTGPALHNSELQWTNRFIPISPLFSS